MLAACSRQEQPAAVPQEFGTIEFSIIPQEGPVTRAVTSYTEAQAHETRINSVQVLVFGDDGRINFHKDLGTGLTGSISSPASRGNKSRSVSGAAINCSFCCRVRHFLMAYSARAAAVLSPQRHSAATASGGWERVNFAPFPDRCIRIRCAMSTVSPV